MKKNTIHKLGVLIAIIIFSFSACKKDKTPVPFQDKIFKVKSLEELNNLTGFAALYQKIFKPNCAYSNCHDGSFEPDFRTMYSAYNTLVYHSVFKVWPDDTTIQYRVLPGKDRERSMIYIRMTTWDGGTGLMPLYPADQEQMWIDNKEEYSEELFTWIEDGALDIFGNEPTTGNPAPQPQGMQVFKAGETTNPYPRPGAGDIPPIEVGLNNSGGSVDIWFSFIDDETAPENFQLTEMKVADNPNHFDEVTAVNLDLVTSITEEDFWGNNVSFTHKANIDISQWNPQQYIYVRVYIQDGEQTEPSEVPNETSNEDLFAKYFTIKLNP